MKSVVALMVLAVVGAALSAPAPEPAPVPRPSGLGLVTVGAAPLGLSSLQLVAAPQLVATHQLVAAPHQLVAAAPAQTLVIGPSGVIATRTLGGQIIL